MKRAICLLRNSKHEIQGTVNMEEIYPGGPTFISVRIFGLSIGKHGFHIHRSGNETECAKSLCDHYNPEGYTHGNLNDIISHAGDLGNLTFWYSKKYQDTISIASFVAYKVFLSGETSVLGRSCVVHSGEDDLGKGGNHESLITGNSGSRVLWGIIAVNEKC